VPTGVEPGNSTAGDGPPAKGLDSLPSILKWRAVHQPERLAYLFLADGETEQARLTYAELDRRARCVARALLERGEPGDRVLLLYPASLDYIVAFFGCLYAGMVAVSTLPPRPNRALSSLARVASDSGAKLALTTEGMLSGLTAQWGNHPELTDVERLTSESLDTNIDDSWQAPDIDPEAIAFLQYTSGSTSAPRGVMVTHANLFYNCSYMKAAFGLSEESLSVTWAPHFHDMGLIEGLSNPVFAGCPVVVIPPVQFVRRPMAWLRAISRYKATHSGGPNFAFDLCARKVKPADLESLDLSSWKTAYCGAEPIRMETFELFAKTFTPCGFRRDSFYPSYGLAEGTLMISGGIPSEPPVLERLDAGQLELNRVVPLNGNVEAKAYDAVGCGRTYRETEVRIVDPGTGQRCPEDYVGEIWVGGPTVARGYWERPEATIETFGGRLSNPDEGPFLRTGDLGFVRGGELFITGRLKDLIIIRASNYYPQDIEWAAFKAHPALRSGYGVAFSADLEGEERLVIVHEVEREYRSSSTETLKEIAAKIQEAIVAQFDLEVFEVELLNVGGIPTTSSGKLRRQACRSDYLSGHLDTLWASRRDQTIERVEPTEVRPIAREELLVQAPRDRRRSIESYLRRHLGDLIGVSPRRIHPRVALGALGIDSLKGNELVARLQDELQLELSNTMVWNHPTIADVAEHLADVMGLELGDSNGARNGNGRGNERNGRGNE
jgi:acyl-CoA synthetase (AMP-forming)/AMP-acid ligase II/acyl carrier protein